VIWYVFGVIETFLAVRFFLRLLAANPNAGFTDLIYSLSYPFVAPFLNVFGATRVEGSVFEWSTLLAMLVYWLVAWGIVKLLVMSRTVSTVHAARKLEEQEDERPL
jgi:hypothetical protein